MPYVDEAIPLLLICFTFVIVAVVVVCPFVVVVVSHQHHDLIRGDGGTCQYKRKGISLKKWTKLKMSDFFFVAAFLERCCHCRRRVVGKKSNVVL